MISTMIDIDDTGVQRSWLLAMNYLTQDTQDSSPDFFNLKMQLLIKHNILQTILSSFDKMGQKWNPSFYQASVVVRSLTMGSEKRIQFAINFGILDKITHFIIGTFKHYGNNLQSEKRPPQTCLLSNLFLALRNIAGGTVEQAQSVIDTDIFSIALEMFQHVSKDIYFTRVTYAVVAMICNTTHIVAKRKRSIINWDIEKIIWIGHLKNDKNNKCFFSIKKCYPKDLILFMLSFSNSKFDKVYNEKYKNLHKKRFKQIEYLIDLNFLKPLFNVSIYRILAEPNLLYQWWKIYCNMVNT